MDECGIYGVVYTEDSLYGKITDNGQITKKHLSAVVVAVIADIVAKPPQLF